MSKTFSVLALFFLSLNAFAVYQVGDVVDNLCWKDAEGQSLCLQDAAVKETVKVLLYNAGWCGPCNEELAEISQKVAEFDGKPVTLLSLSASGFTHGSEPSPEFLKSWKAKHNIPFPVLASPKDAGKLFIEPPLYIPNVAIVGQDGRLAYKEISPGVDVILAEVNKLLGTDETP